MVFTLSLQDIVEARNTIQGIAYHTPLTRSTTFSQLTGREVWLKLENLQKTGSFKVRGAFTKVASLSSGEKRAGVVAASAGNHAQGVAYAARQAEIDSTIVMPFGVPIAKLVATKSYGAKVILGGQTYDEAYMKALALKRETGQTFIHAFDDKHIISGQGTVGLEIIDDFPEVRTVVVPVGGGGLISGMAVALKAINPKIRVIGVQAQGAAAIANSLAIGKPVEIEAVSTIADGIAIKHPGGLTFEIINSLVDEVVTVNDEEIAQAIMMLLERSKILAEGAGAVSLAAVMHRKMPPGKLVAVISGGNIDVHILSIIIERGLTKAGRYIRLKSQIPDRPGALQRLLAVLAASQANVISISHDRIEPHIPIASAEVNLILETRDAEHVVGIISTLEKEGYEAVIEGGMKDEAYCKNC